MTDADGLMPLSIVSMGKKENGDGTEKEASDFGYLGSQFSKRRRVIILRSAIALRPPAQHDTVQYVQYTCIALKQSRALWNRRSLWNGVERRLLGSYGETRSGSKFAKGCTARTCALDILSKSTYSIYYRQIDTGGTK